MSQSLSSQLFGGALGGEEGNGGESKQQTGESIQHYKGPGSFASQSGANFTSTGRALSMRNDMISAPGKFKGLVFEGVDPTNPWGQ